MKILLVTTTFAPRSSSNSIRTTHIVKYLERMGHTITVITYQKKYLSMLYGEDKSLLKKIEGKFTLVEVPGGFLRKRIYNKYHENNTNLKNTKNKNILTSLLIPDPHIDAFFMFFRVVSKEIRSHKPEVLITFAYPYTMHLIGYFIKKKFPDLKWVADYGDPWTDCPATELNIPGWRKKLDFHLERRILEKTNAIFVTTESTKELYSDNFPEQKTKISVFTMGYDPDDFGTVPEKSLNIIEETKVKIVHTGRIYSEARNPAPFLEAYSKLLENKPSISKNISIYFIGEIDKKTEKIIDKYNITNHIKYLSWVPLEESISWMKCADYLLLFGNFGSVQIPGKLFQYIGSKRPIMMLYENAEDPAISILKELNNSLIVKNETEEIQTQLEEILNGSCRIHKNPATVNIEKYSWESICKGLDEKLQDLITARDFNNIRKS